MMANLEKYPLRKTHDCRTAIARSIKVLLEAQEFRLPKSSNPFKLAAVYETWASFNNTATTAGGKLPAAAVLPDRPVYEDSGLTPRMLEETWSGGDPNDTKPDRTSRFPLGDGSGDGYALFTHSEVVIPFVVIVRASTAPMRSAIVSVLEDVFLDDGSGIDPSALNPRIPVRSIDRPIRFGRLVKLPAYYDRTARLTLQSHQLLDTESSAIENRWQAQFEIQAHAIACVLRRVRAMRPKIQLVVDGTTAGR